MTQNQPRNLEASVKNRLLNIARDRREELQSVLTRYAIERFLYRLSISAHRKKFVLKGASLFTLWLGSPHRPTRDLDLLMLGDQKIDPLIEIFQAICHQPVEADGLAFDASTVQISMVREHEKYAGLRVIFRALLGKAVIPMQIDLGFGDAITPEAWETEMPTLLEGPAASLSTYPRETVVAEKCEAMVDLGLSNSRLKDFYDLWFLATHFDFQGAVLCRALGATFQRRGTSISIGAPPALTSVFYTDMSRSSQWNGFWKKSVPAAEPFVSLISCVELIHGFVMPPLSATRDQASFDQIWLHRLGRWETV